MVRHDHPGLFISFEGLGGAGVSNQAALLAAALKHDGYRVTPTEEPTNHLIGGLIRSGLTHEWQIAPDALQLLFAADRAQHVIREIEPALEAGRIVISNRYALSGIAYGAVAVGDEDWLLTVNSRFIQPDLTFIINVAPKICAKKLKEQHYEIELYREEKKLAAVWTFYERLADEIPGAHIIDGERDDLAIVSEIKKITLAEIGKNSLEPQPA